MEAHHKVNSLFWCCLTCQQPLTLLTTKLSSVTSNPSDTVFMWFVSYLINHRQAIKIGSPLSELNNLIYGDPVDVCSSLLLLYTTSQGPWWHSGYTLTSYIWGWQFTRRTLCGNGGSCLPMVDSLQYWALTKCMYWFPLLMKAAITLLLGVHTPYQYSQYSSPSCWYCPKSGCVVWCRVSFSAHVHKICKDCFLKNDWPSSN